MATILMKRQPEAPNAETVTQWQARMRQALFETVDEDAIRDVVSAIVNKAKGGDLNAARLLLTYAVGSPTVQVKKAVIKTGDIAPLPTPAAKTLPGTTDKIDLMAKRASRGLPVNDPRDRTYED